MGRQKTRDYQNGRCRAPGASGNRQHCRSLELRPRLDSAHAIIFLRLLEASLVSLAQSLCQKIDARGAKSTTFRPYLLLFSIPGRHVFVRFRCLRMQTAVFFAVVSEEQPGCSTLGQPSVIDDRKLAAPAERFRSAPRRIALVAWCTLATTLVALAPAPAASTMTLSVEASDGLPGFHRADLSRYLASHMAEARLADWRFEPV